LRSMFLIEPERGCSRGCTYCVMRRTTNGGMRTVPPERVLELVRSEEHTSELQSRFDLVCRLLLEKKNRLQALRRQVADHGQLGLGQRGEVAEQLGAPVARADDPHLRAAGGRALREPRRPGPQGLG